MGRPVEEITDWLSGGEIDDDAQMKIMVLLRKDFLNNKQFDN
jgi:hypothetical protein